MTAAIPQVPVPTARQVFMEILLKIICQMDLEKALWKMVLIDLKLIMEIYLCGDI